VHVHVRTLLICHVGQLVESFHALLQLVEGSRWIGGLHVFAAGVDETRCGDRRVSGPHRHVRRRLQVTVDDGTHYLQAATETFTSSFSLFIHSFIHLFL